MQSYAHHVASDVTRTHRHTSHTHARTMYIFNILFKAFLIFGSFFSPCFFVSMSVTRDTKLSTQSLASSWIPAPFIFLNLGSLA
jgi:hypothetical protein